MQKKKKKRHNATRRLRIRSTNAAAFRITIASSDRRKSHRAIDGNRIERSTEIASNDRRKSHRTIDGSLECGESDDKSSKDYAEQFFENTVPMFVTRMLQRKKNRVDKQNAYVGEIGS
jgi:hypothetical protein